MRKTKAKKPASVSAKVVRIIALVLAAVLVLGIAVNIVLNLNFTVTFHQIISDKVSDNIRIVELADLHNSDYEVVEALTALGYSIVQAQTAVQSLPKNTPDDVEEKLRLALQSLA